MSRSRSELAEARGGRWANAIPSRAEQSDTKRRAIIREAAKVFNRRGSHGTTLEDVAERLGVSKAALYRYVQNKNDLLCACHEEAMQIANEHLDIGERTGRNGLEKIHSNRQVGTDVYSPEFTTKELGNVISEMSLPVSVKA